MSKKNEGILTFQAGTALASNVRVNIESGTSTTPPEVIVAAVNADQIGVTEYAVADGDLVAVRMANHTGSQEVVVTIDSAIAVGASLYGAADGKLTDAAGSGSIQAIALEAAAADDDIIEVLFV